MPEQPYIQSCPRCGGPLAPNASGPHTAPWRCDECRQSYYAAELTQDARAAYRMAQRDYGTLGSPAQRQVATAVREETHAAAARGTSLRRDQLGLVTPETMDALLSGFAVHPSFAAQMRAAGAS